MKSAPCEKGTRLNSRCDRTPTVVPQQTRCIAKCTSYVCHETPPLLAAIPIQATLSVTQTCIRRDAGNCAARECRDRQRDRNILLSKRFTRGLLKVVVARAPRNLRSETPGVN